MKVMVAVDGSPASHAAVETAVRLFGDQPDVHFVVLSVVETALPVGDGVVWGSLGLGTAVLGSWDRIVPARERQARQAVDAAAQLVPTSERVIDEGDPASVICEAAEEHHADLLVLGMSDKGVVARLLDPPVSEAVLRETPLPVLVVRASS